MNKKNNIIINILILIIFIGFMLSELFDFVFLRSFDEVLALFAIPIIFYLIFKRKNKIFHVAVILFLLLICLGVLSSFIFRINSISIYGYFLDAFLFSKPYLILIAGILLFLNYDLSISLKAINIISKIMLFIIFIFSMYFLTENAFFINGRRDEFTFTTNFTGALANWIILFLLIIVYCNKYNIIYIIMGLIIMYANGSGLGYLGIGIIILIYKFFSRFRFKWYYIIFLSIILICLSWNEISGYLLNNVAPRYKLYYYSFITANTYFPFGSGFGTYGTYVAYKYYSPLYIEYGFINEYGMSNAYVGPVFLYDTYYPTIVAQFGYFGIILFAIMYYSYFKKGLKILIDTKEKLMFITIFAYIAALGLGFNLSSACSLLFIYSVLFCVFKKRSDYV